MKPQHNQLSLICDFLYFDIFQWYTWAEILGVSSDGGAYVVKYLLYLVSGTLFALTAAMFVRVFAPYACGSGIPEVSKLNAEHPE